MVHIEVRWSHWHCCFCFVSNHLNVSFNFVYFFLYIFRTKWIRWIGWMMNRSKWMNFNQRNLKNRIFTTLLKMSFDHICLFSFCSVLFYFDISCTRFVILTKWFDYSSSSFVCFHRVLCIMNPSCQSTLSMFASDLKSFHHSIWMFDWIFSILISFFFLFSISSALHQKKTKFSKNAFK